MSWNKGSLDLENGSRIVASSTSSSAVRGGSYNMIFLDEFAFVPHNVAEDFFSSVYPTISSGKNTKVVIVSTPNGMNYFTNSGQMQRVVKTLTIRLMFTGVKSQAEMRSGKKKLLRTHHKNNLIVNLSVNS